MRLQQFWPPCGPEESYCEFSIIHGLADRLEKYTPDHFTRPVLGSLETGEINAVTLLAPDARTHLVVFESELTTFANLFSKAVALAMPFNSFGEGMNAFFFAPDKVRRHLQDFPEALQRFQEVVLAYLLKGRPRRAPQYFAPPSVEVPAAFLLEGLEFFVLGHEYGHVLAGHLADGHGPRRLLGADDGEVTEVTWKWEQEHEADLLGWHLCMSVMTEECDLAVAHAGVELFFSACETLERALSMLITGRSDVHRSSATHPPVAERRDVLQMSLRELYEGEVEPAITLGTAIRHIVNILWEHTAPVVLDRYRRGVQPDPRWTTPSSKA
ncbi:hypothetical protein ACIQNT_25575 [Streptomyces luteogriseus]|uniref:Uncharacterized protein n=1 Tax=Streptomyces luteogriseus TaxID=68233 RepID=A0A7W7DSE4_9ACTN|nr:hypothetical protein [Streptomyces luteogriseus]MBB4714567.1 hypothetical protein [Streptomyces luteogriseus]